MDLPTITKELGEAKIAMEEAESALEQKRAKFFEAATAEVAKKPRKVEIVEYTGSEFTTKAYNEWIKANYPEWILYASDLDVKKTKQLSIIESPTKKKFTFINPEDNTMYVRNVMVGASMLDDEALIRDYPDVWQKITKPRDPTDEEITLVAQVLDWNAGGEYVEAAVTAEFFEFMMEWSDWEREIDYAKIEPEDQEIIEKYTRISKISEKLEIREVKDEDLDENDD